MTSIPAHDRERIVALAARLRMTEWPAPPDTLIAVGDGETFHELVRRGDGIAHEVTQRGHRSTHAVFASVAAAVRALASELGDRPSGPQWTPAGPAGHGPAGLPGVPPPPDPDAVAETATVLAAAADIGWRLLPSAAGDLVTVGQDDTGRSIGYRDGMFEYRSFAGDHRTVRAAASTAGAARRLLVTEAAAIGRLRRRQQPTQLRVRGPAAGFTVTRSAAGFAVEGSGLRATFAPGPVGQQQALVFTHVATATLADILASHRSPTGAPLLDSGQQRAR